MVSTSAMGGRVCLGNSSSPPNNQCRLCAIFPLFQPMVLHLVLHLDLQEMVKHIIKH